jgi:hypothetical protein
MLKASDVRIGNYVFATYEGTLIIQHIALDYFHACKQIGMPTGLYSQPSLYPIPLTEEWFKRLGFHKRRGRKLGISNIGTPIYAISDIDVDYCFYYADFRDDYGFNVCFTDSPDPKDKNQLYPVSFGIKYVHQLQNLYYSLTGEELN